MVDVPVKSHILMSLNQEDERIEGVLPRRPYIDTGLAILKMDKEEGSQLHHYKDLQIAKTADVELIMEAGSYIVLPRSSGCSLKRPDNAEAEQFNLMDSTG